MIDFQFHASTDTVPLESLHRLSLRATARNLPKLIHTYFTVMHTIVGKINISWLKTAKLAGNLISNFICTVLPIYELELRSVCQQHCFCLLVETNLQGKKALWMKTVIITG